MGLQRLMSSGCPSRFATEWDVDEALCFLCRMAGGRLRRSGLFHSKLGFKSGP